MKLKLTSSRTDQFSGLEKRSRYLTLGFVAVPILGAFICGYSSYSSPFFCPFKALTGIPCPGCGLTRSFTAIALGQWSVAVDYHLFGPVLFLGFLIAIAHCSLELITGQKQSGFYLTWLARPQLQLLSGLVILGYHLTRLEKLNQIGELGINFRTSPLGAWLLSVSF